MTAVGEEFRLIRDARYQAMKKPAPPWVRSRRNTSDFARAKAALATDHPLRALVTAGVLPVRRARLLLDEARR